MVRDMLQNRVYCGYVSYAETIYQNGFGQGKAGTRGRRQWVKGIHNPIISEKLFEAAQAARAEHAVKRKNPHVVEDQLLSGLLYCARCLARKPLGLKDDNYGKRRSHTLRLTRKYYECAATKRGYEHCGQHMVKQEIIDAQVIEALHHLHERLPPNVS